MEKARAFAVLNRQTILHQCLEAIKSIYGKTPACTSMIHHDHDHIQLEEHGGKALWIHRKGANQLKSDTELVIAGSMGTSSYHVISRDCEDALSSCSHGAGRLLTRTEAARTFNMKALANQMLGVIYKERPALVEESPNAYRDIDAVMRAQKELVKITRKLTPLLSYKGN